MYPIKLDCWYIGIRKAELGAILHDYKTPFHILKLNKNGWTADPFLFVKNGDIYIFGEYYDYRLGRGIIAYAKYNEKTRQINDWEPAIVEPYHLSFPYIYEKDGDVYIIPESNHANCLCRYKAIEFPRKWKKSIIDKGHRLADTALFSIDNQSYGYTLQRKMSDPYIYESKIFIDKNECIEYIDGYYNDDPSTRRLGGAFFESGNSLVKVAQDCSHFYGEALVFSNFYKNENGFQEEILLRLSPEMLVFDRSIEPCGIHTYNAAGGYEIIDIKSRRLSLIQRFWNLKRKISNG